LELVGVGGGIIRVEQPSVNLQLRKQAAIEIKGGVSFDHQFLSNVSGQRQGI
jgi:hypothetical protein